MATIALGVAAAATAASAASQAAAASSGGKGGGAPAIPKTPRYERILNRGVADLLDEERRVTEDALAQANFLTPEMYRMQGYEPIFEDADPGVAEKANRFRELQTEKNKNKENQLALKDELRRVTNEKKRARPRDRKALRQQEKDLKRQLRDTKLNNKELIRSEALAQRELGDAQAVGRRMVGIRKLDEGPSDPTSSENDAFRESFNLLNESLNSALRGEEPVDPTLANQFDEEERALRERLRRQLGPDFESSDIGVRALGDLADRRSRAFSSFNQQAIRDFSALTEGRATALSNLTAAKMQQLLFPSSQQIARGAALGAVASDINEFTELQEKKRTGQFEKKKAQAEMEVARNQRRAQAIAGIGQAVGQFGQGVAGAAGGFGGGGGSSLGRFLGPQTTQ